MLKHHIRAFPFLYYLKSMVTCKNMKSKWIVVVLYGGRHTTSISNKISLKAMYDPKVIYIVAWHIMHVFNCYCIKQTTNTSWKLPSVLICAHRLIHHQVLAKRFMNVVFFCWFKRIIYSSACLQWEDRYHWLRSTSTR